MRSPKGILGCVCGACGAMLRLTKENGNDAHSCGWKCRGASHVGGAPRCSPIDAPWKSDLVPLDLPQLAKLIAKRQGCRDSQECPWLKTAEVAPPVLLARSLSALSDRGHQYHNLALVAVWFTSPCPSRKLLMDTQPHLSCAP